MNTPASRTFPHHLDWNGVYHSVCLNCFVTVATSFNEDSLSEEERQHRCEETPARLQPVRSVAVALPRAS